ncbi:hypothetical protein, partial [[Eubacterium] cellulosolvens]
MAFRRFEALLLIAIFVNSAGVNFVTNTAAPVSHGQLYHFVPPDPQFSSEATAENFTIPYPVPRPAPIFGEISVLVIAVEFSDYNHTLSIEEVATQTITRLDDYYRQVSYDAISVVGRVVGWIRLPDRMSSYGTDNGPFVDDRDGDGSPDSWRLLKDAVPMVANEV